MTSPRHTFEFQLDSDQYELLSSAVEKYKVHDEGKALRIVLDYLVSNPDVHEEVFTRIRCLHCE
jgi:hypothetical protein